MKMWSSQREPTEMDMVMSNIAQIEEDMRQKFFQLGEMYYEENGKKTREDIGEKYFEIVDRLRKLDENRKSFYKNKLRLEGQMQCENCGAIIAYGSVFCNVCGKKADEKSEEAVEPISETAARCPRCGAVIEEGSLFCASCGEKVTG